MKKAISTMIRVGILLFLLSLTCQAQTNGTPKGVRAPAENFTGIVWLNPLAADTVNHWSIAKVTFEPAARSKWHTHIGKQILVIAEGTGYLKEKGKPVQVLHKGDWVSIEPGVEHWHGATPENEFVQIVMNPYIKNGVVNWLKFVTDEEYKNIK